MDIEIRPITAQEWPLWRDLRIRAVTTSPDAFRASLDEERKRSDESWEDIIGSTVRHPLGGLWVAEADSEPVGMLFARLSADSLTISVGAMWVAAEVRRGGIGKRLLRVAIDWGRVAGAESAELWVTTGNSAAASLYRGLGFEPTGATELLRTGSPLLVTKLKKTL